MRQNMAVNDNNGCLCSVSIDLFIQIFSKQTVILKGQWLLTTILISNTIIGFTKEDYGNKKQK